MDLLVQRDNKEHAIIEVQSSMERDYLSRILYGASKTITEYIHAGDEYRAVRKIISVSIVLFDLGHGEDYVYRGITEFRGVHQHDLLRLGENEKKAYGPEKTPSDIFPEYYLIKVGEFDGEIKDKFDEWVYFLKTESIKLEFTAKGIKSAAKKLDILALSDQARRAYERYKENTHYEASMHASHYGRGVLDGKAQGLAEGEAKANTEMAKKLLGSRLSIAEIAAISGLSEQEILALQ